MVHSKGMSPISAVIQLVGYRMFHWMRGASLSGLDPCALELGGGEAFGLEPCDVHSSAAYGSDPHWQKHCDTARLIRQPTLQNKGERCM